MNVIMNRINYSKFFINIFFIRYPTLTYLDIPCQRIYEDRSTGTGLEAEKLFFFHLTNLNEIR